MKKSENYFVLGLVGIIMSGTTSIFPIVSMTIASASLISMLVALYLQRKNK